MTGPDGGRPTDRERQADPGGSRTTEPEPPSAGRIILLELLLLSAIGVTILITFEVLGINGFLDGLNEISPVADHALEILGLLVPLLLGVLLLRTVQARQAKHIQQWRAVEATRSQGRLEGLVSDGPAVIYSAAPHGDFATRYISPNMAQLFGHDPETVMAKPGFWLDHVHPDDRAAVAAGFEGFDGEGTLQQTYRYRHADGSYRWVEDGVHLVYDGAEPLELVGYMLDVTDREEAEAELVTTEARFRAFAEHLKETLWIVGPDGRIEYVSPAFEDLFGIPMDSLEDGYGTWLDTIHPEDRPKLQALAAAELGSWDLDEPLEYRVCPPDGTTRWLETRMSEVRDTEGEVRWVVGITSDITARKDAQALREEAVEQEARLESLEASAGFRTRFLNRAAHDLATPLTPARFELEALASPRLGELNNAQTEALATLRRNLDRFTRAVEQLVLAAQLEAGQVTLHTGPVDLGELVQASATAVQGSYLASDKELVVTIEEEVIVEGDRDRLATIVDNLLDETRQLLPAKQAAEATVTATETTATLTIEAKAPVRDRLADQARRPDLEVDLHVFVARQLAEAHGGSLVVEEGRSLRFVLELPM